MSDCPSGASASRRGQKPDTRHEPMPANITTPVNEPPRTIPGEGKPPRPAAGPSARYVLEGKLGQGGMGTVYRARDELLGRAVALKFIRADHLTPALRARFEAEARAVAQLDHPHIIKIFDVGEMPAPEGGEPSPYLALEYVPGGSLAARLTPQPLAPELAAKLVALLARATAHAHERGIVHRDLKPDNVLLAESSHAAALNTPLGCPKITDFGLVRELNAEQRLTGTGFVLGTPAYMSPEQADGQPDAGPAADVHALGVILYRLLSGRLPFDSPSPAELRYKICRETPAGPRETGATIPEELERICLDCLEKTPARRPTAAELAGRLERYLERQGSQGRAEPVGEGGAQAATAAYAGGVGSGARRERVRLDVRWRLFGCTGAVTIAAGLLLTAVMWELFGVRYAARQPSPEADDSALADAKHERKSIENDPRPVIEKMVPAKAPEPLMIRPLQVLLYQPRGKEPVERGRIGEKVFAARVGDAVTVTVELSEPAYFYLIGFNADGREQLLWPAGDDGKSLPGAPPEKREKLRFPFGDGRLRLDAGDKGGLQVFAVAASREQLPAYRDWQTARRATGWKALPAGTAVYAADAKGVYAVQPGLAGDRTDVKARPGVPPLAKLCRALQAGGAEAAEAVAFPVLAGAPSPPGR